MRALILAMLFAAIAITPTAQARTVSLVVTPSIPSNDVEIAEGEVAEIVSVFHVSSGNAANPVVKVWKNGYSFTVQHVWLGAYNGYGLSERVPQIVAGPARIELENTVPTIVTIRIEPETFPPDKSIIIPEGTSARVVLETSTNLASWAEVWTDNLTNAPTHMFYRVRAEYTP